MSHASEQNFADAEVVQPGPLPRRQPGHPHLDPVRGRHPPVHRRRLRQHGDERHAADLAARIRVRHNVCRRGAHSLPRRGHCAGTRRARRCLPTKGGIEINDSQRFRAGVGVNPTEQMVVDVGRGIELCYEQIGDPNDPPIVLIGGLGQQLHGSWPTDFATALAGRGYRVTRFDNRDVGRSTHMDFPPPKPLAILRGGNHPRQYHLGDMARDTVGLLDVLGYQDVHLAGISMGGMIAQTVAAHYPGRVRTLTSIMSTTGAPRIGRPALSTWRRLATAKPPRTRSRGDGRAIWRYSATSVRTVSRSTKSASATGPPSAGIATRPAQAPRGSSRPSSAPVTAPPNSATSMCRHW